MRAHEGVAANGEAGILRVFPTRHRRPSSWETLRRCGGPFLALQSDGTAMTAISPTLDASRQPEIPAGTPRIVEPANPLRWIGIALVAFVVIWIGYQFVTNPNFGWSIVARYMLDPTILHGVLMTIWLTVLVMVIGIFIGVILAVMRISGDGLLGGCSYAFVWFFRATPTLVQLVFWYNMAALFPILSLGIPFDGPKFFEIPANDAISSFTAAMLGLGLIEAAYMSEIIRAGLLSVDPGQNEASKAVGHKPWQTFWVVVFPQAMKAIIPPSGNQLIGTLKFTSLASVVGMAELMHSAEVIYSRTFEVIPLLIVAALWYLIMVSILSVGQYFIERHYSRGWRSQPQMV
jgi:polar amino acid transport system permease protein